MAIYSGISLSTLQEALALAQAALPLLERGESVAAIATGDKRITFTPATPAALKIHIRELQTAIAISQGQSDPRARPSVATWTR